MKQKCNTAHNAKSSSSQTRPTSAICWAKSTKMPKKHSTNNKTTNKRNDKPNKNTLKNKKTEKKPWLLNSIEFQN